MILTRTPYRLSLIGGGTDYPEYYKNNGGAVISTTIDKYCYLSIRELPPFFEHKHHITYSAIEAVKEIDEIRHPSIRECFRFMNVEKGLSLKHDGDLPARSGIGSSSAFTVGLLHALYVLQGKKVNKFQLANDAIHVEQDLIKENVGCQDQIACSVGGFNLIEFYKHGSNAITPLNLPKSIINKIQSHLMLVFTGFPHMASDIAKTYKFDKKLTAMQSLVKDMREALRSGDTLGAGRILAESWQIKRGLSPEISTPYIDWVYERSISAGACGGKLIGAGGGGFMLLVVEPDKQDVIRESLRGLLFVPFKFENGGSQIVFNNGQKNIR